MTMTDTTTRPEKTNTPEELADLDHAPPYYLKPRQIEFVKAAEAQGFEVDYTYSGRGMYGRRCPAVRLGRDEQGAFGFRGASLDGLGLGSVIYMT